MNSLQKVNVEINLKSLSLYKHAKKSSRLLVETVQVSSGLLIKYFRLDTLKCLDQIVQYVLEGFESVTYIGRHPVFFEQRLDDMIIEVTTIAVSICIGYFGVEILSELFKSKVLDLFKLGILKIRENHTTLDS